jgi:hypothetical protein
MPTTMPPPTAPQADDEAWWAALAGAASGPDAGPDADAHLARQLGLALREAGPWGPLAAGDGSAQADDHDPAQARRQAALLARARQAGLLDVDGPAANPHLPVLPALSALPAAGPQRRPPVQPAGPVAATGGPAHRVWRLAVRGAAGLRGLANGPARWRWPVGGLAGVASLLLVVWTAGPWLGWGGGPGDGPGDRPGDGAGPGAPAAEVLRGGAPVATLRFEQADAPAAAAAAQQAQQLLQAQGLEVDLARQPDAQAGLVWVLAFHAPVASTPVQAQALAAQGLPAWRAGPQRWVFSPAVQRGVAAPAAEGAASKATKPAQ